MKIIQEGFKELFYKKEITKNQNSFNVKSNYKYNIVWKNVIAMIYLHFGGLYGCFLFLNFMKQHIQVSGVSTHILIYFVLITE